MWAGLFTVVIAVLIVWWLLTRNAQNSSDDIPLTESHHDVSLESALHSEQTGPESSLVRASTVLQDETVVAEEEPTIAAQDKLEIEDDLEIIEGIGPKISVIFKAAGIKTFTQLAEQSPDRLKDILTNAGITLGDPTTWPEQAKLAAAGDEQGLQKLQDNLRAGRKV